MRIRCIVFCWMLLLSGITAQSQENQTGDSCKYPVKLNVSADLMSQYVWRGTDYGSSPSIQPALSLTMGNFELGAWGAIAAVGSYKETDLYVKYTIKNVSLCVTDYYIPGANGLPASPDTRYLVYNNATTAHTLEGTVQYKRPEKIPFWVLGSVYFYGNDKRWGYDASKDTTDGSYYSSYFEAGYTFKVRENRADLFMGFTPAAGAYGNTPGVVNVGITGSRSIAISKNFQLPVKASLIVNPQTSDVFFLFGITL